MKHSARILAMLVSFLFAQAVLATTAKTIKLDLKVVDKPAVIKPEGASFQFFVENKISLQVIDKRTGVEADIVGEQKVDATDIYVWQSTAPVASAVQAMVTRALENWSVHVAPDAKLVLTLGLTRFFVDEKPATFGSTYVATVDFDVALTEKGGKTLWTGIAVGEAKRSGVDGRASSCNESLTLALRRALSQILSHAAPTSMENNTDTTSGVHERDATPVAAAAPGTTAPPPPQATVDPDSLFAELTRLKDGGVAEDVLVSYVEQRRLSRPLSVDDILKWKNAGLPDAAIKAAGRP